MAQSLRRLLWLPVLTLTSVLEVGAGAVLANPLPAPGNGVESMEHPVPPAPLSPPLLLPSGGIQPVPLTPSLHAEPYTLAVGDRIQITVANVPEFTAQYQVLVDGSVELPVIGNVPLSGLSLAQAARELTAKYVQADVLYNPTITVTLLVPSVPRIAITGEVNRPGAYSLATTDGKLPTLTEALQKAGGITERADLRQIQVLRPQRSGPDRTLQVSLWELLRSGDLRQDISLRDGDSVVVPMAAAMNPAEARLIGSSTVVPASVKIAIIGEARQSGVREVPPNTSLNQVLLDAGGFSNRARRSSVELVRMNPNGTVTRRRIRIDFSQDINEQTNPILWDRDVIIVNRNSLAAVGDTLGTLLNPVGQAFSLFNLFRVFFPQSP
jgi:polysaccharide export outer membrane protein